MGIWRGQVRCRLCIISCHCCTFPFQAVFSFPQLNIQYTWANAWCWTWETLLQKNLKEFERFQMLHWLKVISLSLLPFLCTKASSSVKRPTHLKLPKSFQRLIFLSQAFIFLQRTVLAFLLFMQIQIAQSRKTSLIFSRADEDEPGLTLDGILWCTSTECDRIEGRQFPPLFLPPASK